MKRVLLWQFTAISLIACLLLGALPGAALAAEEESAITISTVEDLKSFRDAVNGGETYANKTVILTTNLDLSGEDWTPIGNNHYAFQGTFDGGFHTIYNLTIDTSARYCGLFGRLENATVKNLGIENANITSSDQDVAVLAGNARGGTISRCYVTGTVKGPYGISGILGSTHSSAYPTHIDNCYARVAITATGGRGDSAGISGWNQATSVQITNCYSACIGERRPIAGWSDGSQVYNSQFISTYFDATLSPNFSTEAGRADLGRTSGELKVESTYEGWDFETTWAISPDKNGGYPYLLGFTPGLGGAPSAIHVTILQADFDKVKTPYTGATVSIKSEGEGEDYPEITAPLYEEREGVYSCTVETDSRVYHIYVDGEEQQETITQYGTNGASVVIIISAYHTHQWSPGWSYNSTHHWHPCELSGECFLTNDEAAYMAGYDTHYSSGGWKQDLVNHWLECICGYQMNVESHDYTGYRTSDAQHWQRCSVCRHETAKVDHDYDDDQDTTCNTCGYTRTVTPAHSHAWADAWSTDDAHHWHECTADDCDVTDNADKDSYGEHSYSGYETSDTQHWQRCSVCRHETAKVDHDYDDDQDTTCNTCGYTRTVTPAHSHAWADAWSTDDAHHWHECIADDCDVTDSADKDGYGEHSYSGYETSDAQHWQKCSVCQAESAKADHVWDEGVVTQEPTATVDGSKTCTCTLCDATKTETFPALGFGISGVVTDSAGDPVNGATVKLLQGNTQFGKDYSTEADGVYSFIGAKPGVYNIVATADGVTMTQLVTVDDGDLTDQALTMPNGSVSSVLDIKGADTPDVVVGGLEAEAESNEEAEKDVTVIMTVEAKTESDADTAADIAKLKETAPGKTLTFLSITVEKQVDDEESQPINETVNRMVIVIPFDKTGKKDVTVYRCHDGVPQVLTTSANADGEYFTVGDTAITVYAKKFSTYAIGYTEETSTPVTPVTPSRPSSASSRPAQTQEPESVWPFEDVTEQDWCYAGVKYVYDTKLMEGVSEASFAPDLDTSRAMITTILWRLAGSPTMGGGKSGTFPDVPSYEWYTEAIEWAAVEGVVKGYGDGNFGPNDPITREQMALMLWRYAGSPETTGTLSAFADGDSVSSWVYPAMEWAVEQGILNGRDNAILAPQAQASRAEAAAILQRFCAIEK